MYGIFFLACFIFNLLFLLCYSFSSLSLSILFSYFSLTSLCLLSLSLSLSFDSNQRLVATKPLATSPSTCSLSLPFRIRGLSPQASYSGRRNRRARSASIVYFFRALLLLLCIWVFEGFESTLLPCMHRRTPILSLRFSFVAVIKGLL